MQGYTGMTATTGQKSSMPIPTLTLAVARTNEVNKRLCELSEKVNSLAQTIGGPFPVGVSAAGEQRPTSGVVDRLNEYLDDAHRTISIIEEAVGAIGRTLGE